MGKAKDIIVKAISASSANKLCQALHYSKKVVRNSQLHFGVFLGDNCYGVMQFGPSINKKGTINLVNGTKWNGFIELNRMAFGPQLPRNSESRAIAIAINIIKKNYPHIEWIVSFADATQCGDGTIYRASGFILTAIRKNDALRIDPQTGKPIHVISAHHAKKSTEFSKWQLLDGYQLRYIYLINKHDIGRLTVPIIPFTKIKELGISMYKGQKQGVSSVESSTTSFQEVGGGESPTDTLQFISSTIVTPE